MRKHMVKLIPLVMALCLVACLTGCGIISSVSIKEDGIKEDLPEIDPEAGVAREMQVRLYYRLTDEEYLVGVTTMLTVQSNERTEKAMVRELIEGIPPLTNNISSAMPAGTKVVDVSPEGGIMYITLSNEFFNTDEVDKAETENLGYLETGFITQQDYDARVEQARQEMYLVRRLAVLSIVNTVSEYDPDLRVQLLFDLGGSGSGTRVERSELGFDANEDANSNLTEPMTFDQSVVADPLTITKCALDRMMNGEYEKAYVLFAETESGGLQKPTYANFESELMALGRLTGYTLYSYSLSQDMAQAYVMCDLEFTLDSGNVVSVKGKEITLRSEGVIYKLGYGALLETLGVSAE